MAGGSSKRSKRARLCPDDSLSEDMSDQEENVKVKSDYELSDEIEDDSEEHNEGDSEDDDDNKDAEIEELEKEYKELRSLTQDILRNLKRDKGEDAVKGQAVKNQKTIQFHFYVKALWDKMLEFRFLLQKPFNSSNRLPQEPVKSSFGSEDENVSTAYTDLVTSSKKTLDSLLKLLEALLEKNPSVDLQHVNSRTVSAESNKSDTEDSDEWQQIAELQKRMSVFRNKAVDKWQRRTQVTSGAAAIKGKLHAFNQCLKMAWGSSKRSKRARLCPDDSESEDISDQEENVKVKSDYELSDEIEDDTEEDNEGDSEDDDDNKDAEMEELEKEYEELRSQAQDILRNLKRDKGDDAVKGQSVKNQKALWDKILEFRFLLQKPFNSSNRLPQEPVKSSFCSEDDENVSTAYADLVTSSKKTLDSLLELLEALLEKNPSVDLQQVNRTASAESNKSDTEDSDEWQQIAEFQKRMSVFRNKAVDKWQRRTQVTSGAAAIKGKLHAFNQNVSEQVASYMRDPSRMIKQMQQSRSTIAVFGTVPGETMEPIQEERQLEGDPELIEDAEFYQQLLKEFIETIDPASSEADAMKKFQTKKRKLVDRRASKSRKIRYNVNEKIVNFMAPRTAKIPPNTADLLKNLFCLKNRNVLCEA